MKQSFSDRKRAHLAISLTDEVQGIELSEWHRVRLEHHPLPEFSFSEVDLSTAFLTAQTSTPYFISAMTAGHSGANAINLALAKACARRGWIFGVGSQRRELEEAKTFSESWEKLRKDTPGLKVIGNLGAAQAVLSKPENMKRLLSALQPDVFALHLNALQEVIQPEGTPDFRGIHDFIGKWDRHFPAMPLMLKETGCGFSRRSFQELKAFKHLFAIDVSGAGGTHWGRLEGIRAKAQKKNSASLLSKTFKDWGISTVQSVVNGIDVLGEKSRTEIWGSGGVSDGLQAAKLIALGAHRVGFAKGALAALQKGTKELEVWMELKEFELKTALFCMGYRTVSDLRLKARKNQDVHYVV